MDKEILDDYNDLENIMCKKNLTLAGFFEVLGKKNSKLLNLSETAILEYNKIFKIIKAEHDTFIKTKKYSMTDQERGAVLEKLVQTLFYSDSGIFRELTNLRTKTNEIDVLVSWSQISVQVSDHTKAMAEQWTS